MNRSREPLPPDPPNLTQALVDWRDGDQDAGNRVFAAAYRELQRLAAWHLQRERLGHTLQATALVNELYLKLFGGQPVDWHNRAHFFAVAAQQIRRLLVDYARAGLSEKRGGGLVKVSLTEVNGLAATGEQGMLDLDDALRRLEMLDNRAAHIVELRYFGGATEQETAEAVGVSVATVKRDWDFARAWLISQLKPKD